MTKPVTPLLAVDTIIELIDRPDRPIVLIRRGNPPPGWALPGGFVDLGETLEQAAVREAREETALHVKITALLGCYSEPKRDPRGHTVSIIYIGEATGKPQACDDAANIAFFAPSSPPNDLAFDHGRVLHDYREYLRTGQPPAPRGE